MRREPGELYALRHDIPVRGPQSTPVEGWVERLDPETLAVTASTPRLPGGAYWPGGIAAHARGDLHMVFGRWAHRLSPELDVLASHRLPVARPHNSFVVLDGGELVTKDCDAPAGREPSTVSVLDPETLLPVAAPLRLPEPCIARLSSDGESVIAVGTTEVFRLRLDRDAGRIAIDEEWRPRYGPAPDRSYGWDPVITDDHVLWMDNGRNESTGRCWARATRRGRCGCGGPAATTPKRCARPRSAGCRSGPSPTRRHGSRVRGLVLAYDAGQRRAARVAMNGEELEPHWRRDGFAHAGHLIVYPDTRELVAQDWQDAAMHAPPARPPRAATGFQVRAQSAAARRASIASGHDDLVVLDLDSGEEKARVDGALFLPGVPLPGAGLRPRRLLPVAHDDRPRGGRVLAPESGARNSTSS